MTEPIERAHGRIIHALGVDAARPARRRRPALRRARARDATGRARSTSSPARGRACSRPTSRSSRTRIDELVGDLPDAPSVIAGPRTRARGRGSADPYKRIPPPEYFLRLAGISVPRGGLVSCPVPRHRDRHPSCSVGTRPEQGWCCHSASCGARGAIYDLASVLDGGPWGAQLRGEAFARARARVIEAFAADAIPTSADGSMPDPNAEDHDMEPRQRTPALTAGNARACRAGGVRGLLGAAGVRAAVGGELRPRPRAHRDPARAGDRRGRDRVVRQPPPHAVCSSAALLALASALSDWPPPQPLLVPAIVAAFAAAIALGWRPGLGSTVQARATAGDHGADSVLVASVAARPVSWGAGSIIATCHRADRVRAARPGRPCAHPDRP